VPIIWVYTEIKEIDMFIYKGRIYRYSSSIIKSECTGCYLSAKVNKDASGEECGKRCRAGKVCTELFISRLFHAIIEVFYGEEK
jgi:hypothetical protein